MKKLNNRNRVVFRALAIVIYAILMTCTIFATERVVFVQDEATGNGSSATSPIGSLQEAYNYLGNAGGTIVVCGKTTINSGSLIVPSHNDDVIITSLHNNVDYRGKNNASIDFYGNLVLSGPTVIERITLQSCVTPNATNEYPYRAILGRANDVTIGQGVYCERSNECNTHLSLIGGSNAVYSSVSPKIEVNSGTWQRVRGGASKGGSVNYNIQLIVNGGTFVEKLVLASESASGHSSHSGDISAVINGGVFYGGICVSAFDSNADVYVGSVDIVVNGGEIHGILGVAFDNCGVYNGEYNLTINGGDFSHLTDLRGSSTLNGDMISQVHFGDAVDPDRTETGTLSFTNYIRPGADPFVFYHNGYYYYTSTGNTEITLSRAANLSDLKTAAKHVILEAPAGYSDLWSPEIHHFSDSEIGDENEGWYLFFGAQSSDDTSFSGQRQYVVKCLNGDDFFAGWGNPVTGVKNMPQKIKFTNDANEGFNEAQFCAGTSIVRVNGQVYMTFVSEKYRNTPNFHQTINITTFKNPWTVDGTPVTICKPDYPWEMIGYGKKSGTAYYPKVVEGASPVYGADGSVYLMYTGSGYWTTYYALGFLKYNGGDPLNPDSWTKNPTPVFVRDRVLNESSITGCGHASYFTDANGQMWAAYHGYIGKDTSSDRFTFLEPMYVSKDGVSIGEGTTHPANIEKEYTFIVNPKTLSQKTNNFHNKPVQNTTESVVTDNVSTSSSVVNETKTSVEFEQTNTTTGTSLSNETKSNAMWLRLAMVFVCTVVIGGACAIVVINKKRNA